MTHIIKKGPIKVPTQPKDFDLQATGLVFKSYDNQIALEFNVAQQDGTPADLLGANLRLLMFIYDEVDGTIKKEPIPFITKNLVTESFLNGHVVYILPEAMKAYNGMVEAYVYIEYPDGSTSDNLGFTFRMKRSAIDGLAQDKADYFIEDFKQLLDGVKQEATDAVNEALAKVEVVSENVSSAQNDLTILEGRIDQANREIDKVLSGANEFRTDIDTLKINKADKTFVDAQLAQKASQEEVNVLSSQQSSLIANAGNVDGNAELLDHRIDADGNIHIAGGDSSRFAQKGRLLDYEETALSFGYKRFIPLPFEVGGITYTNGNDSASSSSIRTPSGNKVTLSSLVKVLNTKNSLYRFRYIAYNPDGSYNSYATWSTSSETDLVLDPTLLYRFEIGTINGSAINFNDALKSIKFVYLSDKVDNLETLSEKIADAETGRKINYTKTPMFYGFKKLIQMLLESGSITPTNGNDANNDLTSVRSRDKVSLTGNFYGIIDDPSMYKWRFYTYNSDGTFHSASGWFTSSKNLITIDPNLLYRVQVSTVDGSVIDLKNAPFHVIFAYASDVLEQTSSESSSFTSRQLEFNQTPLAYGLNNFLSFDFKKGSINTTNGNDNDTDTVAIKTVNKIALSGNVLAAISKSLYRVKFFAYNADGTYNSAKNIDWKSANENTFAIDTSFLYRIQIATTNGTVIDLVDALNSVFFGYLTGADVKYANGISRVENDKKMLMLGRQHTGYVMGTVPDYWQAYLDEKIAYIRGLLREGTGKSVFLATTDTHYQPGTVNDINPAIPKYLANKLNIDTFVHYGDLVAENNSRDTFIEFHNVVTRTYSDCCNHYFPVRGNHDDCQESGYGNWDNNAFTQSDMYSSTFRSLKDVHFGKTGTYYYHDNDFEKMRYIFLDCIDFVYERNAEGKINEKVLAWGIEQLQWFANALSNTPNGYHIVIINHAGVEDTMVTKSVGIENSKQTKPVNSSAMIEILKAYKNKAVLNFNTSFPTSKHPEYYAGTLTADYTNANGLIVGFFSGHEHIDDIQEISDTGVKNVFTLNNSVNFASSIPSSAYQPSRSVGTISEEMYDVVIVDRTNRNVRMVRIGAGNQSERTYTY
ncbi:BppU family phage baseplate upper protein [Enterococcus faecium]|nr:BppU family phage baseplate upper protein [Enterococcus faecium]EME8062657.1 BppU family phage baseplate upper protein [Enterococcus faecium]